jgi:hypothetical protein
LFLRELNIALGDGNPRFFLISAKLVTQAPLTQPELAKELHLRLQLQVLPAKTQGEWENWLRSHIQFLSSPRDEEKANGSY